MLNYQRVSSHILGQIRQKTCPTPASNFACKRRLAPLLVSRKWDSLKTSWAKKMEMIHHGDSCWSLGSDWHEKVTALLVGGWKTHLKNDGVRQLGWLSLAGHLKIYRLLAGEKTMVKTIVFPMVNIPNYISGWCLKTPSEKWWSSSVGMMTFPTEWKNKKNPNHQPD